MGWRHHDTRSRTFPSARRAGDTTVRVDTGTPPLELGAAMFSRDPVAALPPVRWKARTGRRPRRRGPRAHRRCRARLPSGAKRAPANQVPGARAYRIDWTGADHLADILEPPRRGTRRRPPPAKCHPAPDGIVSTCRSRAERPNRSSVAAHDENRLCCTTPDWHVRVTTA